jgi:hypothetical protein
LRKVKTHQALLLLFILSALVLQACGGPDVQGGIATGVAQTQQISALETAAAGGGAQVPSTAEPEQPCNRVSTPGSEFTWEGDWFLYLVGIKTCVHITQAGDLISGSFVNGGRTLTFSGTLSADKKLATGTLENAKEQLSAPFQLQIKADNPDQFGGGFTFDGESFAWCGSRAGAPKPDACHGQ